MLSSKFKLLQEEVADKRNAAKMLNEKLLVVNNEKNILQSQLLENLIENFTGSKEELLYMLDARNNTSEMHVFREKFLKEKSLETSGMSPETSQVGIKFFFYKEFDDKELKKLVKSIEDIFPLLKPVKVRMSKEEVEHVMLINTDYIAHADDLYCSVYLVERDGKYCVKTFNHYYNKTFAEWSENLEEVLKKARENIILIHGIDESYDEE